MGRAATAPMGTVITTVLMRFLNLDLGADGPVLLWHLRDPVAEQLQLSL